MAGAEHVKNCANAPCDPAKFVAGRRVASRVHAVRVPLGSTLFYPSVPLLAVDRFAEVFPFTVAGGSDQREHLRDR